jgi:hypothetical protein
MEASEIEEHDIVRFKKEGRGYLPGVRFEGKVTGFSKDRKRIGIEEDRYSGCTGQMIGGSYYSIPIEWVTDVQRWVPISSRGRGKDHAS